MECTNPITAIREGNTQSKVSVLAPWPHLERKLQPSSLVRNINTIPNQPTLQTHPTKQRKQAKMSSPLQTPSRTSTPTENANVNAIPDSSTTEPDLPLTMASSMILTALPRDAASALSSAGTFLNAKVTVRFKPVGSAPQLRQQVCRISSSQRFEAVVAYLRRVLKVGEMESVFLYVNSSFAPALDEVVGNLHRVSRMGFLFLG